MGTLASTPSMKLEEEEDGKGGWAETETDRIGGKTGRRKDIIA